MRTSLLSRVQISRVLGAAPDGEAEAKPNELAACIAARCIHGGCFPCLLAGLGRGW